MGQPPKGKRNLPKGPGDPPRGFGCCGLKDKYDKESCLYCCTCNALPCCYLGRVGGLIWLLALGVLGGTAYGIAYWAKFGGVTPKVSFVNATTPGLYNYKSRFFIIQGLAYVRISNDNPTDGVFKQARIDMLYNDAVIATGYLHSDTRIAAGENKTVGFNINSDPKGQDKDVYKDLYEDCKNNKKFTVTYKCTDAVANVDTIDFKLADVEME